MIRVQALSKNFNNFQAVDQVSFEVQRGEVLGFLGPNGAGKSTTMKMLTCFIPPSSGWKNFLTCLTKHSKTCSPGTSTIL